MNRPGQVRRTHPAVTGDGAQVDIDTKEFAVPTRELLLHTLSSSVLVIDGQALTLGPFRCWEPGDVAEGRCQVDQADRCSDDRRFNSP